MAVVPAWWVVIYARRQRTTTVWVVGSLPAAIAMVALYGCVCPWIPGSVGQLFALGIHGRACVPHACHISLTFGTTEYGGGALRGGSVIYARRQRTILQYGYVVHCPRL